MNEQLSGTKSTQPVISRIRTLVSERASRLHHEVTIGLRHGCRHGRMRLLILMLLALLTSTLELHAQSRTATSALVLQVRQEEFLQLQTDQAALKIRLAGGRMARIWSDTACTSPSVGAIVITKSGTYNFPLSDIQATNKNSGDAAGAICLESSDGVLHDSIPLK